MTPNNSKLVCAITFGSKYCTGKTEERKLIQTNIGVYLSMITIVIFDISFLSIGNQGLIFSGVVQTPFFLLLPLVLLLNMRGQLYHATLCLFVLVMLDALAALVFAQGVSIGLHYYFLLFAVLPASFFHSKHWPTMLILFFINMLLYGYFEVFGWPADPSINLLPSETLRNLRILMISSCVCTVLLLIVISEYYSSENERNLQYMADTDVLTGLPNRRAFMQRFELSLTNSSPFCLLLIDVDHFKRINDAYGHQTGDKVLRFLAHQLRRNIRSSDFIGRIGGEEFAMVQFSPSPADSIARAEKLCRDIAANRFVQNELEVQLTISIGACLVNPPAKLVNLMTLADAALYEAKNHGRNQVVVTESQPG